MEVKGFHYPIQDLSGAFKSGEGNFCGLKCNNIIFDAN